MSDTTHIHVRDARDQLIDLLGIGQTYPLRDLAVRDEQLTVAFNTPAKIPIENSQKGVLYQLHDKHKPVERKTGGEQEPCVPIEAKGNGETIVLETYKIKDDITFEIHARKQISGKETYLHQTATVKVGLDTALKVWIREMPYLNPGIENPTHTTPRIIDYGTIVDVEIENSQEGVDYRLVCLRETEQGQAPEEVELSVADVRGDLHNIILTAQPVYEDTDIRVRATKMFDPSENRDTQRALLDAVLPLKVRANPALPVWVDPTPIIDYRNPATIKIADTQESANYQLYIRPIHDRDFIHKLVTDTEVIKVSVEGEPDVQVRKPTIEGVWKTPEEYVECGDAQQGTDGELEFETEPLTDDSLVIVRARKDHQASLDPQTAHTVPSTVQLEQAAVIMVRPNPEPPLRLKVLVQGGKTSGDMQVFDGQPGVFYYFRLEPEGDTLGLPAYFHKRDDRDEKVNKGLGQLTVGVDYVIARSYAHAIASVNLEEVPPEPPLLQTGPLPTDSILHIQAVKAQSRVATSVIHAAGIHPGPEVSPKNAVVDYGAKTRIRIKASRAKELYQLLRDGIPLGDPVKGTGKDRLLETGKLEEDTTFEVLVKQPDEPIVVERVLRVAVQVRPDSE